jgi:hypothetical protein
MIRRLLREPLLHFFVAGALLFGVYALLDRGTIEAPDEIVISQGQLRNLQLQFERVWHRHASQEELQGLVDNWVREEILYREGVSLGLDRDDTVVRRRVGQKLEFIIESAILPAPTDVELQAWLEAHVTKYQIEPVYSLRQVYFDPARHGDRLDATIATARGALAAGKVVDGDATLLPASLDTVSAHETRRIFGDEFADALTSLPAGAWHGPVPSAFGVHLVALAPHAPARIPALAEVRTEVQRDLSHARLQEANAAFYEQLRAKYLVRIEATAGAGPTG